MSKISLRSYNQEIESLINRGQTEEAIGHCKYILKIFPKHIETYKLLGKAYLEAQRYAEASDILARVLSVVPDDFVSQIGLSIIREDEGNLDAAIWHMERAYEIQPSNSAIQEELRRLYGRRDGIEPHKIRLTRGALVRLYYKGDLFQQAIAEAKSVLADDPDRLDLLILLAKCYQQSGKKIEAAETSTKILNKLPYCFEANKIIASVLSDSAKADDARPYQQRVNALDPYEAHVSRGNENATQVADSAITLEHLEWHPSIDTGIQPEWVSSMGIQLPEEQTKEINWAEAIPEEIEETDESEGTAPESIEEPAQEEHAFSFVEEAAAPVIPDQKEEPIPDWMKEAGWEISESTELPEGEESVPDFQDLATITGEESPEIEAGILPDWLREIAPSENETEIEAPEDLEKLDFLERILPPASEEPLQESITTESVLGALGTIEELSKETEVEETPDWLKEIISEDQTPLETTNGQIATDEAVLSPGIEEDQQKEIQEGLDWLERLAEEHGAEQETIISSPHKRIETPPDWISESISEQEEPGESGEPQEEKGEWDWLREQSQIEETPDSTESASIEKPIFSEEEFEAEEQFKDSIEIEEAQNLEVQEESISPFLQGDQTTFKEEVETPKTEEPEEEDAFSWLESLAARQGADEATLVTKPEERDTEVPAWLSDMQTEDQDQLIEEQPEQTTPSSAFSQLPSWMEESADFGLETEETKSVEIENAESFEDELPASQEEGKSLEIDDAAMGWLEALAAKHGADEETLSSDQTARSDTPPDWIRELSESEATLEQEVAETSVEESKNVLPDWIRELESETQSFDAAQVIPEIEEEAVGQPLEIEAEDQTPEWLKEEESVEPIAEAEPKDETETLPDWLDFREIASSEVDESIEDQTPDWLSSLSTLQEQEAPSEIEDIIEEIEETEAISTEPEEIIHNEEEPETEVSDLPDWLQQLDNEITVETSEFDLEETITSEQGEPGLPPQLEIESEALTEVEVDSSSIVLPSGAIEDIRTRLLSGEIDLALEEYASLIENGEQLDIIIDDLQEASYRHPVNANILQTLGDAYAKADRIKEALNAYTKAEELLLK